MHLDRDELFRRAQEVVGRACGISPDQILERGHDAKHTEAQMILMYFCTRGFPDKYRCTDHSIGRRFGVKSDTCRAARTRMNKAVRDPGFKQKVNDLLAEILSCLPLEDMEPAIHEIASEMEVTAPHKRGLLDIALEVCTRHTVSELDMSEIIQIAFCVSVYLTWKDEELRIEKVMERFQKDLDEVRCAIKFVLDCRGNGCAEKIEAILAETRAKLKESAATSVSVS